MTRGAGQSVEKEDIREEELDQDAADPGGDNSLQFDYSTAPKTSFVSFGNKPGSKNEMKQTINPQSV